MVFVMVFVMMGGGATSGVTTGTAAATGRAEKRLTGLTLMVVWPVPPGTLGVETTGYPANCEFDVTMTAVGLGELLLLFTKLFARCDLSVVVLFGGEGDELLL